VAEGIKASVATNTRAGSKPTAGGIFLRASDGVWREVPPSPPPEHGRYLRVPTKKSAKTKTHVFKLTVPSPTAKTTPWPMLLRVINKNKK